MTRVGLILGAGGIVGQAYHAGVLVALERDLGWDPRTADLIIGTSAGSLTGTLLRLGVPSDDLAAWAVGAPRDPTAATAALLGEDRPEFRPIGLGDYLRPWHLPSMALITRTIRRPWAFRPGAAAMTLVPSGRVNLLEHTQRLDIASGRTWPTGLWICAARRRDGHRTVFGRAGSPKAPLADAVSASCAVPGYFSPVTVDGVGYIDGGVHSPTNADIARTQDLDLAIVISPMSAAVGSGRTADGPVRHAAHRRLEREVRRLRAAGTTVVRFEPGRASLHAMGVNAMADDRSARVVQEAFFEAGEAAQDPRLARRLAPLVTRTQRQAAIA